VLRPSTASKDREIAPNQALNNVLSLTAATANTATAGMGATQSGALEGFECSRIDGLARPLLVAKGSKGYAACAYVDIAAADKFGEACVIFSGVATHEAFLDATVAKASKAAKALGVKDGMPGRDALALIK
jgi:uncharacterized protein YunC (DUF1805 family)